MSVLHAPSLQIRIYLHVVTPRKTEMSWSYSKTTMWRFLSCPCTAAVRLGAHWQLKSWGDKKFAVKVRALQLKSCLHWQFFIIIIIIFI